MALVDAESVTTTTVPADAVAKKGYLHSHAEVVGKVLATPFAEGQPFTESCFATGELPVIARTLAVGMRVVSVSLTQAEAGPVYAGGIVDVLFSYTRPAADSSQRGEPTAMTLLQGIQVLAVNDRSVVSERETGAGTTTPQSDTKRVLVMLRANSTQAKALHLAQKNGSLSLALRNPLDVKPVDIDTTVLRDLSDEYSKLLAALTFLAPPSSAPEAPSDPRKKEEEPRHVDTAPEWVGREPASVDAIRKVLVNRSGASSVYEFRQPRARLAGLVAVEPESTPGVWIWKEPSTATDGTSHSGGK
jgi:Flp pilus assembly protein CpaB